MRKTYVIASVALIAMASAYFLGRVQPNSSGSRTADANAGELAAGKKELVPDLRSGAVPSAHGGPSKSFFSALQARADAGDTAASTRLYRGLSLCHRFRTTDWSNTLLANELLGVQTDGMAPTQLENYKVQLDAIESRKQNMQRWHALCNDADDATLDSLVPNLRKAAQLGEEYARACYLAMGPNYDARALLRHPEWLETYRASVPSMIDAGMAAGDWRIVNILRSAYQPGAEGLLAGALGSDPVKHFRYLKLYRLGAGPGDIDALDQQLAVAAARLPPERLAEASDWAETTFRRSFDGRSSAGSPGAELDSCIFPYE